MFFSHSLDCAVFGIRTVGIKGNGGGCGRDFLAQMLILERDASVLIIL